MMTCKDCVRYKDGYCIMLKQTKGKEEHCKLFESRSVSSLPLYKNNGAKGINKVDWELYLMDVAKVMLPSFSDKSPEDAAQHAVSYATELISKLNETLNKGY